MNDLKLKFIIFFLVILITQLFFIGCDDASASMPGTSPDPCVIGQPEKKLRWRNFYMSSHNGRSFKLDRSAVDENNAFYGRCNTRSIDTSVNGGTGGVVLPYRIINTGFGTDLQIRTALGLHRDTVQEDFPSNGRFPYYVCGIDSFSYDLDPNRVGYSINGVGTGFSYLEIGKLKRIQAAHQSRFITALLVHELGHQLAIDGHGNHSGIDNERCVMKEYLSDTTITPYVTFCDNHACWIYNHVFDTENFITLNERGTSGSLKFKKKGNLEVEISLAKDTFLVSEMIIVNLKIKNTGNSTVFMKKINDNFINNNFIIKNSSGIKARFIGVTSTYIGWVLDTLKQGEERTYNSFLLYNYTTINTKHSSARINGVIEAGKYRIVFLRNDEGEDLNSNTLESNVIEPKGIEQIAYNELLEIYNFDPKLDYGKKAGKYREFVFKYSSSVYMPQVFDLFLNLQIVTRFFNEQTVEDCKWFINKNPNSDYLYLPIVGPFLYYQKRNSDGYNNYLNEIISKHPNTKAASVANEELQKTKLK